jgi:hypothetical protein
MDDVLVSRLAGEAIREYLACDVANREPLDMHKPWTAKEAKLSLQCLAKAFDESVQAIDEDVHVYFAEKRVVEDEGFIVILESSSTRTIEITSPARGLLSIDGRPIYTAIAGAGRAVTAALAKVISDRLYH